MFTLKELNLTHRRLLELLKNFNMSILYRLGKANVVVDAFSRLSTGCTSHVKKGKRELHKDVHRLAHWGVNVMDSTEGGIGVTNGTESSLVSNEKEKQDQDPILLFLKVKVHTKKVIAFEQGGYGVVKYQGRLFVPKVDKLQERIIEKA